MNKSSVIILALLASTLCFGWRSAFPIPLFVFNYGHSSWNKFHPTVAAVWSGMEFAMIVEVILAIKLIFSTKLAGKSVWPFTVKSATVR